MIDLKPIGTGYKYAQPTFLLQKDKEKGFKLNNFYKIVNCFKNQWNSKVYYIQNETGNTISIIDKFCKLL